MDWNDLQYFLTLARTGTLSAAARELGVRHTTVGRRVMALERTMAVRLFTRGPAGLVLTDAGKRVLRGASLMGEHVESIERGLSGVDTRVAGTVRVTIPESIEGYFVRALATLRERHPDVTVELLSENRCLDMRRSEADLAVRFREVEDSGLIVRKLGVSGWSLYASPDYLARRGMPESPEDLHGHDVIGFEDKLADIVGASWLRAHSAGARYALRCNATGTLACAAAVGFGVAPLPCFFASQEANLVRVSRQPIGARDILLVVHPDLQRVARIRATIDFLVQLFARDRALWSGA